MNTLIYIILFSSVFLGLLIAYLFNPKKQGKTQLLLTFSGSYLLSISLLHLIPHLYENIPILSGERIGMFILFGLLLQICLEYFSKGIEHGHVHKNDAISISIMISLCLHALIEGIPLSNLNDSSSSFDILNNPLLFGIFLHKIPVSIVLCSFFIKSQMSKRKMISLLILFACMSPLGFYMGNKIEILNNYNEEIMAIVVGVFLYISTTILFESSDHHKLNLQKIIAIIAAIGISLISSH